MEEFKITVIVPIYNTEKYIRQCAKSLFSQTLLEGVEFLFINDGSSDNSIFEPYKKEMMESILKNNIMLKLTYKIDDSKKPTSYYTIYDYFMSL